MAPAASEKYMALVAMLTLLTAFLLLLARIFKLGFLADFLSRTALVGFLTGVGVQVGVAMLPDMLGVEANVAPHIDPGLGRPARPAASQIVSTSASPSSWSRPFCSGGAFRHFPVSLVVVVGTIAASAGFDFAGHGVATIGHVPGGLPSLRWPDVSWEETLALLPVAVSCFVMIIAQSAATSRVYALRHKERVDENADILGLAVANAGAALTGAFVVNGSPTQTAMADNAGARSQFAQMAFAGVVVVVLVALTGPLRYLPHCVLASIVFTIAVGMIDVKGLKAIRRESAGELRLALFTAAAVPCIGVEQGILLAIAPVARAACAPLLPAANHDPGAERPGTLGPTDAAPGVETAPGLIVYRFGADLFYANVDRFVDEARELIAHAPSPTRRFVIDAGAITDIDYSAAAALRDLLAELKEKRIEVAMGRVNEALRGDLERHGVAALLSDGRICSSLHVALALADGGAARWHGGT